MKSRLELLCEMMNFQRGAYKHMNSYPATLENVKKDWLLNMPESERQRLRNAVDWVIEYESA